MLLDSLTPVTLTPLLNNSVGVYIGIDVISGRDVFWNVELSPSPHVLVVGPSGSGKTVTLSSLIQKFVKTYNVNALVFDIKDEYGLLLSTYGGNDLVISNPLEEPLPICYCDDLAIKRLEMIELAVNSVSKVFSLSTSSKKLLIKALTSICSHCLNIDNVWQYEFDSYDKELVKAVNTLTTLFNVYTSRYTKLDLDNVIALKQGKIFVVNLKQLFLKDRADSATAILYLLNYVASRLGYSTSPIPRIVVVIDELWHAMPFLGDELVNMLTRYGRGIGLALFIATQGIDDLKPYNDVIVNSCGVFMAMSTPSANYFQRLQQYLGLSKKAIDYVMSIAGQGIAVARIAPSRVPFILYVDPFDHR